MMDYEAALGDPIDVTSSRNMAELRYNKAHLHMHEIFDSWTVRDILQDGPEDDTEDDTEDRKETLRKQLEELKGANALLTAKVKQPLQQRKRPMQDQPAATNHPAVSVH